MGIYPHKETELCNTCILQLLCISSNYSEKTVEETLRCSDCLICQKPVAASRELLQLSSYDGIVTRTFPLCKITEKYVSLYILDELSQRTDALITMKENRLYVNTNRIHLLTQLVSKTIKEKGIKLCQKT